MYDKLKCMWECQSSPDSSVGRAADCRVMRCNLLVVGSIPTWEIPFSDLYDFFVSSYFFNLCINNIKERPLKERRERTEHIQNTNTMVLWVSFSFFPFRFSPKFKE